jgi:multidrug efflux pump
MNPEISTRCRSLSSFPRKRDARAGKGTAVAPEATAYPFRPILLTTAGAILGMIPIAPTVFWGPMAYAIMGGLAVATLLTVVFLPALYVTWFRIKNPHPSPYRNAAVGETAMSIH